MTSFPWKSRFFLLLFPLMGSIAKDPCTHNGWADGVIPGVTEVINEPAPAVLTASVTDEHGIKKVSVGVIEEVMSVTVQRGYLIFKQKPSF